MALTVASEAMANERDAAVYELEEIWDDDWFQEGDHRRIQSIIDMLPSDAGSLVDVGCGNGLFVNTLSKARNADRPDRIVGVDRSEAALRHVDVEKHKCDIGALPFDDGEFDIVTCLEVVEHLPLETYRAALAELARVSKRWAVVSVPYRQNLRASLVECPECATRFNADYHLRSFDEGSLRGILSRHGFRHVATKMIGEATHYIGYDAIRGLMRPPQPPSYTICPMCGYEDRQALARELARKKEAKELGAGDDDIKPWKRVIKRLWPQRSTYTWCAVLLEKEAGH
jgi:SAM-dependent methyltransferase